jgi:hypothetical protein
MFKILDLFIFPCPSCRNIYVGGIRYLYQHHLYTWRWGTSTRKLVESVLFPLSHFSRLWSIKVNGTTSRPDAIKSTIHLPYYNMTSFVQRSGKLGETFWVLGNSPTWYAAAITFDSAPWIGTFTRTSKLSMCNGTCTVLKRLERTVKGY